MWKDELDKLQITYPTVSKERWNFINDKDMRVPVKFRILHNELENIPASFDENIFFNHLVNVINKNIGVQNLVNIYKQREEDVMKRAQARQKSWSHVTCLKFTHGIANTVCQVGRGFKTIGVQSATLVAYLWMLAKAKKQGACPYFKFIDTTEDNQPK
jgi:hypothetical protein